MIYTILFEADKHWGAGRPEDQYQSSYVVKRLLAELKPDLFISLGDFYETKLLLNSKSSVYALRDMHDKADICKELGIPMRVIRGTLSHDYDQLAAFSNLVNDDKRNYRTFTNFTIEETLPGLKIAYCPDENISYAKFRDYYFGELIEEKPAFAAAHGDFDVILPQIAVDAKDAEGSTSLVQRYGNMIRHLNGPIIAGHWHDCNEHEHLYYAGSPDRWKFGEDHPKGYILMQYDTEQKLYRLVRPHNFLEARYKTFMVYSSLYKTTEDYQALISAVEQALYDDPYLRVKIKIHINEDNADADTQVLNLKFHFNSNKQVSFDVENEVKAKKREEEHHAMVEMTSQYGFIRRPDNEMSVPQKIQAWIKLSTGRDRPLEVIERFVNPELEKYPR